jgi:isopenicillin N synthase-like dioxygenase
VSISSSGSSLSLSPLPPPSGQPDAKEGIYFGEQHELSAPEVIAAFPMHGPNQWPEPVTEWREAVLLYMQELTVLGTNLMRGVALSLGLPEDYFEKRFCRPRPFTPFRIFHYPGKDSRQGVGRHTDYGVLTILWTDSVGGLEVENTRGEWVPAPPINGTFLVNIGDMLELWYVRMCMCVGESLQKRWAWC